MYTNQKNSSSAPNANTPGTSFALESVRFPTGRNTRRFVARKPLPSSTTT